MNRKKINKLKTEHEQCPKKTLYRYAVIVSILEVLTIAAFGFVFHRAGYTKKLLQKVGIAEQPVIAEKKEPINHAVRGWNNTLEKLDYTADIVFFGDSITCGSDFRPYFPDEKIVNLGYPGDSLVGMSERVSGVAALSPRKIFVLGGINGLKDDSWENSLVHYEQLLDKLLEQAPDATIYVQSVLPISKEKETTVCHNDTIRKFNDALHKLANRKNLCFLDVYSLYEQNGAINPDHTVDGVHLYPNAYEKWANLLRLYISS